MVKVFILVKLIYIYIDEAEMNQSNFLKNLVEFNEKSTPRTTEGKDKINTFESINVLYEGQKLILDAFHKWNISNKSFQGVNRLSVLSF